MTGLKRVNELKGVAKWARGHGIDGANEMEGGGDYWGRRETKWRSGKMKGRGGRALYILPERLSGQVPYSQSEGTP